MYLKLAYLLAVFTFTTFIAWSKILQTATDLIVAADNWIVHELKARFEYTFIFSFNAEIDYILEWSVLCNII